MDVLRGSNRWGDDMQDDLISRRLALDTVEESRTYNPHNDPKAASMHEHEHRHFLKILMDLPPSQPEYEELTPIEAASEIASGSMRSAWYWLEAMVKLEQMGYAVCRKKIKEQI